MTDRQGIEIDYCPKCRGVWLDRGELDKIIERSSAASDYDEPRQRRYDDDDDDRRREGYGSTPVKKRKRSFFEDLLDFG
jgi:Zn-finger nucleic acid-binding protein